MANSDRFQTTGKVIESIKGGLFKIQLENGMISVGSLAGKLRMNSIKILVGDDVTVDLSPYDLTKCRIIYRERNSNNSI